MTRLLRGTLFSPFFGSRWPEFVMTLLSWHERAVQRRALLEMSDEMLKDIALSRADIEGEASKPFWRP